MNDSSRSAARSLDALTLFALAAGLAMGDVVAAMAERSTPPSVALPAALAFVVFGSAGVVFALAAVPRPRWVAPAFGRWIAAIGIGLLGALAPAVLF